MRVTRRHWRLYYIVPYLRTKAIKFWQTGEISQSGKNDIPASVSFDKKFGNNKK